MGIFPKSWSAAEQISVVVVAGGFYAFTFSAWGMARIAWADGFLIDTKSATIFLLAGILGIPTLTFGAWMCWRRIGFPSCRWLSLLFGVIGVTIWPLMDYLGRAG